MNAKQWALMRKDLRSVTQNRRMMTVLLVVPLVLTVAVPSIFILSLRLDPKAAGEMKALVHQLPPSLQAGAGGELERLLWLVVNRMMPPFFLTIPVMASSVMAASAFVGERERRTLETLLYAPLSLKEIFQAKIWAGVLVGAAVSLLSFAAMAAVVEAEAFFVTGRGVGLDVLWLVTLLLVAPALTLCVIGFTVRLSAKSATVEEAQQRTSFLTLPVMLLLVGQMGGVFMLDVRLMLAVAAAVVAAAVWTLRSAARHFTYEQLLGQ